MNAFEFIIILILFLVSVVASFSVGFNIGISRTEITTISERVKSRPKKKKTPDNSQIKSEINELNNILAAMERYDGNGGITK